MVFSDTTGKAGIIQRIEFWTNLGDATISGDTTLLKVFTALLNESFDRLMPLLVSFSDFLQWDDTNNTDQPFLTFALTSGQSDYTVLQDDNSYDILNVAKVRIYASATGTQYYELKEMTADDPYAQIAMSPSATDVGVPTSFLKRGNTIFLFPQPNYTNASGVQVFFERRQQQFLTSDTTKQPGIPSPFHALLPLYASHDWLIVNKPANTVLITRIEAEIARREKELRDANKGRFPHRRIITPSYRRFR